MAKHRAAITATSRAVITVTLRDVITVTLRVRHEHASVLASLTKLRLENQQLLEDARRIREDPAAMEEAARRELGFIRPGETLVIIRDARPSTTAQVPR